jgi:hypothetical protein
VGQNASRHYRGAAIVRTFRDALREALKLAESAMPGDAEHLRRWLSNNKHATSIFAKLTKGKEITQDLIALAQSADSAKYLYRPSDVEHLKRWLSDKHATTIFAKLTKGKEITQDRMADHILLVLAARRIAETTDRLNAKFARLKREGPPLVKKTRRHAMVDFADGKISQEELDAFLASINQREADLIRTQVPLFVVRSDKGGSRKRTIFCRLLSRICRRTSGRWHDAEVAALCSIAFNCDVTIETVKDARSLAMAT